MYFCPRSLATNCEMVGTSLSRRSTRSTSIRWKGVISPTQLGSRSQCSYGSELSKNSLKASGWAENLPTNVFIVGTSAEMVQMSPQTFSVIKSGAGFLGSEERSSTMGPVSSMRHSVSSSRS